MRSFRSAYEFVEWWMLRWGSVTSPAPHGLALAETLPLHRVSISDHDGEAFLGSRSSAGWQGVSDADCDAMDADIIMDKIVGVQRTCLLAYVWCKRKRFHAYCLASQRHANLSVGAVQRHANAALSKIGSDLWRRGQIYI